MRNLFLPALALGVLSSLTTDVNAGVVIDNFNSGFQDISDNTVNGIAVSDTKAIIGSVFGERTLTVEKLGNVPNDPDAVVRGRVSSVSGLNLYSEDAEAFGQLQLLYDDVSGVDITGGTATAFRFLADIDLTAHLFFEVYSAGVAYTASVELQGDANSDLETYFLAFADFKDAALNVANYSVFQNVESLRIYTNDNIESQDLRIDDLTTVTPEPGTMALLALGGVTLVGARMRRRKAEKVTAA